MRERLQRAVAGTYVVERELAAGSTSRLYLATDRIIDRLVVIKLLRPELTSGIDATRFQSEIAFTARLQHPHILPILSAGARGPLLYYVMPYVDGEALRQRLIRERRLPVADTVRILGEIADALDFAHTHGVVHRDVKPENILLQGSHAVLSDFGVARALEEATHERGITAAGMVVGTPGYMAPEQIAHEPRIDGRADVYALALVGYEMLTGAPPFTASNIRALLAAHVSERPRSVSSVTPEVPRKLSDAIARALAKAPEDRFPTAGDFRDALGTPPAKRPPPRRRRARALTVGACLWLLAMIVLALTMRAHRAATLDPDVVVVAPFDTFDPSLMLWREGLVDVLSRNLDGAGPLRTVSPTVVIRQWSGRADRPSVAALGRSTGAQLAIYGSLIGSGRDSVRFSASILDVATNRDLGDVEIRDVETHMDRLSDSATLALLRILSRTRTIGDVRQGLLGSASLPALKAFLRGEQFFRQTAWDSAASYYQRAIAADSTFALAWRRLGHTLAWQRIGVDSLARAYLLRAARFNHGLSVRESLMVTADSLRAVMYAYNADTAYWQHAQRLFSTLTQLTQRYPDDPEAWYLLADARYHFAYGPGVSVPDEEILRTFDRSIALDSTFAPSYMHAIALAFTLGGLPRAERYIRPYLAHDVTDVSAGGVQLVSKLLTISRARAAPRALSDSVSAEAIYNAFMTLRDWPDSGETAASLARTLVAGHPGSYALFQNRAWTRQRLAEQLGFRGHVHEAYEQIGPLATPLVPELALLGGIPADTAAIVFAGWLRRGVPVAQFALPWWAAHGDTSAIRIYRDRATRAVAEPHAMRMSPDHDVRYAPAAASAYLALARHDTADALQQFEALPETLCVTACFADQLVRARLLGASGRDREAAAVLANRTPIVPTAISVLWALEQGRVAERLGDRARAIAAFTFVVATWLHAEPALQPYVAEARSALERLTKRRLN